MSTYAQERSARLHAMYVTPGRRKARLSLGGARILRMLGPSPWESGAGDLTVNGQNVSWAPAYDERILTQAEAPGFPRGDRTKIEAAYHTGQSRTRRKPGGVTLFSNRRR